MGDKITVQTADQTRVIGGVAEREAREAEAAQRDAQRAYDTADWRDTANARAVREAYIAAARIAIEARWAVQAERDAAEDEADAKAERAKRDADPDAYDAARAANLAAWRDDCDKRNAEYKDREAARVGARAADLAAERQAGLVASRLGAPSAVLCEAGRTMSETPYLEKGWWRRLAIEFGDGTRWPHQAHLSHRIIHGVVCSGGFLGVPIVWFIWRFLAAAQ